MNHLERSCRCRGRPGRLDRLGRESEWGLPRSWRRRPAGGGARGTV